MDVDTMQITRALSERPELFLQEGARRNLLWFAQYMDDKFQATSFHRAYYEILDRFAKGQIRRLIIEAPPQHGKALLTETPVLTTKGWKRHIDLCPGDYVFGLDGKPKLVKWNSGKQICDCQSVQFADGFSLIAARQHEWIIFADHDDHRGRVEEVVETQNIFSRRHRRSPFIPADAVIERADSKLPIDPYLLGVWLGDGNSYDGWISCGAQDIEHLRPYASFIKEDKTAFRLHLRGIETKELRELGVLMNKHIPVQYLLSSKQQRSKLLRGLMDTDGCVNERGTCEFCQKEGKLADDVYVLLRTLGYKPTRHKYTARLYGRDCGIKVRICFHPDKGDKIFNLTRKQERIDKKSRNDRADKRKFFISSVEDCGKHIVNCIEVEGGLYLAGYELVPTHNSQGSSRFLPADMLGLNPDLKICICSYAATIAKDFNRDVQRIIDSDEYRRVFPETRLNGDNVVTISTNYLRNSDVFEIVGHRGSLRVVGRGGSLTSKTVDVMIYDDLYKDSQEANSPVVREGAWDWFTKVAQSRLHNDSQELIVFTRWHPEDIIGKLIESKKIIYAKNWSDLENVPANAWVLVNFEAIKTGEPTEIDPRKAGEPLWGSRHSIERLLDQKELDPSGFQCLYQGNPGSAEELLYQPFKTWVEKTDYGQYIRSGCYIDVADEGDDFLFAATYDIVKSPNQFYNEKTRRFEPLLFALITGIEYTDESTDVTTITVPRLINDNGTQKAWVESNNGGSQFEKTIKKKVRALTVPFYQGANKESRIITDAPFVNQHIIMPFGWESRYPKFYKHITGFLRKFDANAHDDDADGLTGIYEKEIADGNAKPYNATNRGIRVH
jgi:predicted phage terminase large subunit-like protein